MSDFRTVAPPITNFPPLKLQPAETLILKNGIKLHILRNDTQPVMRLSILYNTGLADSPAPYALNIMADTLREGSQTLTGVEFSELLDYHGAWLNTSAGLHNVNLVLHCLTESFDTVMPAISDSFLNPAFPAQEMGAIIRRKVAASKVNREKVATMARQQLSQMLYGEEHPLAADFDNPDYISEVTTQNVLNEWDATIKNGTPGIFVAGYIDPILDLIKDEFSKNHFTQTSQRQPHYLPYNPKLRHGRKDIVKHDSLQCAVAIGIPTISRQHPDYINLRLTVMALGGYFGSRLNKSIREEKGLTYGINASLLGTREGAHITISSQTDNKNAERLIEDTVSEIIGMKSKPLSTDELNALKSNAMSSLASTLDSPFNVMDYYINEVTLGTPKDYFGKQQTAIEQLTADTIIEMANKYFDIDRLLISTAGNINNHI